jgi:hypothetical protein
LNPRLSDVIDYAKSGAEIDLDEAVHHLVPEFQPTLINTEQARRRPVSR